MANTLEYILSLKDQVTGKLNSIGISSTAALDKFAALQSQSLKAQESMKVFGGSIGALREKLNLLRNEREWIPAKNIEDIRTYNKEIKELEKSISKLENLNGGKVAQWREEFAESLPGANLIKNPLVLAGAAVGGLWGATQKAMDAGKERTKLQTLTGSQEIGTALYDGLTKFATDTVFGSEVYDMGVQMLANGIKDADVMPLMKQLGDISMGDANKLGQLSLAFAQINGKGKLAGQELLQLINAGFNPLQVISEKTGESMESLQDKMSKGAISVDQVREAMDIATGPGGKFENMLEKVASTPYGQLEGLKGQIDAMVISIGEVFLPVASGLMNFLSWIGEKAGPILKPLAIVIGSVSVALLAMAAAQWVLNLAIWSNPITWMVAAIAALIAIIVYVIMKFKEWGAMILMLTGPLGILISAIIQLKTHWNSIVAAFKGDGILAGLKRIGIVLLDVLLLPIQQLLEMLSKVPGMSKLAGSGAAKMNEIRQKLNLITPEEKKKESGGVTTPNAIHEDKNKTSTETQTKASKTNEAIATGGSKSTTLNITFKNLVEQIQISKAGFSESTKNMEEEVANALIRVLAMANTTAG